MDAAEDREQDLHDKRMARLKRERDELSALRTALKPFADIALIRDTDPNGIDGIDGPDLAITPAQVRAARMEGLGEYRMHD